MKKCGEERFSGRMRNDVGGGSVRSDERRERIEERVKGEQEDAIDDKFNG